MLDTYDAERLLDASPHVRLIRPKTKYAAVYETATQRQLALERRSKHAKIFIENSAEVATFNLSVETKVEFFPEERVRVHLPAPKLTGPYNGRRGNEAILVLPSNKADLDALVSAYAATDAAAGPAPPSAIGASREPGVQPDDDESAYPEGSAAYRLHRALERDPALAKRAKTQRLKETGRLSCEVCNFDFFAKYGGVGSGFIEAHHVKPVHTLDGITKTKLTELSLVCSNCHRMLHRSKPLLTPLELKARLLSRADRS